MERINTDYIEKIILKSMIKDRNFCVLISNVYMPIYFNDPIIRKAFIFIKDYINEYRKLPTKDLVINSSPEHTEQMKDLFDEIDEIEFDITEQYDFLIDQTNEYLKEKALKEAIAESINDGSLEDNSRRNIIKDRIEEALIKDLKINIGLDYFNTIGERLRKIFTNVENRIATGFPTFDEYINGGFPPLTLSVVAAKIHGGKSNLMANFAARQALKGYNPVLLSLEMAEGMFAQRFDSIFSKLDINRIYHSRIEKKKFIDAIKKVKEDSEDKRGDLFIKEFPTGDASIADFRIYLRELKLREIEPSILYVDYINLMKPSSSKRDDMYSSVKRISEELRALGMEFKIPVVSVSQLNREGFNINFDSAGFNHIAESMGIPATADFLAIMGTDEDAAIYENEIHYKIVKSRFGRPNVNDKFYLDSRSLKMYDSIEDDVWIEDAKTSGDKRSIKTKDDDE